MENAALLSCGINGRTQEAERVWGGILPRGGLRTCLGQRRCCRHTWVSQAKDTLPLSSSTPPSLCCRLLSLAIAPRSTPGGVLPCGPNPSEAASGRDLVAKSAWGLRVEEGNACPWLVRAGGGKPSPPLQGLLLESSESPRGPHVGTARVHMRLEFFSGLSADGVIYSHQGQDFPAPQMSCGGKSMLSPCRGLMQRSALPSLPPGPRGVWPWTLISPAPGHEGQRHQRQPLVPPETCQPGCPCALCSLPP